MPNFGSINTNAEPNRQSISNYVGCAGWGDQPAQANVLRGMFYGNSFLTFAHVTDGSSNTIFVSERDYKRNRAAAWLGAGNNNAGTSAAAALKTLFRGSFAINFDYQAVPGTANVGKGWGSRHPGGLQVLLVDASTHFLAETVETTATAPSIGVLNALVWRDDDQPIESPFQ